MLVGVLGFAVGVVSLMEGGMSLEEDLLDGWDGGSCTCTCTCTR